MNKADKMFEELGYKKESDYYYRIADDTNNSIKHKHIRFYKNTREVICESVLNFSYEINMQELQAINEKAKELGWLE